MSVKEVQYHPPREFDVNAMRTEANGVTRIEPGKRGRNAYTTLGHVVVLMENGEKWTSEIEINPKTGETRFSRITKPSDRPKPAPPAAAATPSPPPPQPSAGGKA